MNLPTSVYSESLPLGDLLVRAAAEHPERVAVAFPDQQLTYREVLSSAVEAARSLRALGVRRGDNVGLLAPNTPECLAGLFGAVLLGAVLVPINVRLRSAELAYLVEHAQLRVLLTTDALEPRTDFRALLADALPGLASADPDAPLQLAAAPQLRHVVMMRGTQSPGFVGEAGYRAAAAKVAIEDIDQIRARVRVRDDALIIYTSGTTSSPKGCVLTHEAVTRGPVGRTTAAMPFDEPPGERVLWCPLPLFHIAALQALIFCLAKGATFLTDLYVDGDRAWADIRKWRATSLWPLFMSAMNALTAASGYDVAELHHVSSLVTVGTATELMDLQHAFPGAVLVNGSGMSETTGHYCLSPRTDGRELRATTSGKPVAGAEVRVVDPLTGLDRPDGEMGECLVRTYSMMSGYYRDPERTSAAIDADGWLHTGDLFRRLKSGHFRYEGRLKDMLKVGGENVSPVEVESFLCGHPDVLVAAVVSRPDPRLDEVPVAFVELRAGGTAGERELVDFCAGRIASYKVPRTIFFVGPDDWPMSATKISKVVLRTWAHDGFPKPPRGV